MRHRARSEAVLVTKSDERMGVRIRRHNVTRFRSGKRHAAPPEFDRIQRLRKAYGPRNGPRLARPVRIEHPVAYVIVIPRSNSPRLRRIQDPLSNVRRADAARKSVR